MKNNLDNEELQNLRNLYTATHTTKQKSIETMIECWGREATLGLNFNGYSNGTLRASVKVARTIKDINEVDRLLGQISLQRLRLHKPGLGSTRAIITGDWQKLAAASVSEEAKAKILQIAALTDMEQLQFGMGKPLSLFKERISANSSSYNRRRIQENYEHQPGTSNANEQLQYFDSIQIVKRLHVKQR